MDIHGRNTKSKFPEFKTSQDLAEHIDKIVSNPSKTKQGNNGRTAYWDDSSQTIVIKDPKHPDGGTVMKPDRGEEYFNDFK